MHRRKTAACRPLPAAISVWCKEKIAKAAQGAGTFPGGAGRPDLRHRPYRPAHPDLQEKAPQRRVIVHRIKIRLSNESRIFMRKIPPITNRALQLIRRGRCPHRPARHPPHFLLRSVGGGVPDAPSALHAMSRTRRAGCPHPAARYAPYRPSKTVIARSAATWQSVPPSAKNRPAGLAGRSRFLRNMYSLSCRCDAATPAPDPDRTSASCSPPPARHSGGTAHSTSQR